MDPLLIVAILRRTPLLVHVELGAEFPTSAGLVETSHILQNLQLLLEWAAKLRVEATPPILVGMYKDHCPSRPLNVIEGKVTDVLYIFCVVGYIFTTE